MKIFGGYGVFGSSGSFGSYYCKWHRKDFAVIFKVTAGNSTVKICDYFLKVAVRVGVVAPVIAVV